MENILYINLYNSKAKNKKYMAVIKFKNGRKKTI